jgi:hypothetical protein
MAAGVKGGCPLLCALWPAVLVQNHSMTNPQPLLVMVKPIPKMAAQLLPTAELDLFHRTASP